MGTSSGQPTSTNGKESKIPVWIAIITGIVTIVVALFNFPPFQRLFEPSLTSTPTTTIPEPPSQVVSQTSSPESPIPSQTATEVIEIPFTAASATSSPSSGGVMYVALTATQTNGRQPLDVRFDARNSYYEAADGTNFDCGACDYYWRIRKDGVFIFGPEKTTGTLEYKFGSRGTYYVSVYVCRSGSETECNGTGIEIIVE